MTDSIRCPDCGRENPAGATICVHCNHPLTEDHHVTAAGLERKASSSAAPVEAPIIIRRPIRPRRPRPAGSQEALQLWLIFGTVAAVALIWVAFQAAREHTVPQVAGSTAEQQKRAEALYAELARDSTSADTHQQLADVLYDTANWPDAIVHYRAALNRDSTRVTAMVDLGVCYYNLSDAEDAERLFNLALARDPNQSVALFNLGIVHEGRGETDQALAYYHRAMQSNPPESMKQPLMERMDALFKRTGKTAPALPGGK
jgi:tetratricopeptide (TPR) repeat protein